MFILSMSVFSVIGIPSILETEALDMGIMHSLDFGMFGQHSFESLEHVGFNGV